MKIIKNGKFEFTGKRAFIIVPEGISHEFERKICEEYGNNICKDVEVLTFTRLCKRIFEKIGGLSNVYLNDAGRILATYKAINLNQENLKIFKAKKPNVAKHILDIIDEFKVQSLSEVDVARALEWSEGKLYNKLYDIYSIYTAYNKITQSLDPRDQFQYLIDNFFKTDHFNDTLFHFAGFDIFSPKQYEFIDELIAKDIEIEISFDFFESFEMPNKTMLKTIEKVKKMCNISNRKVEIFELQQENIKFLPFATQVFSENSNAIDCKDVFLHTAENVNHECLYTASKIIEIMSSNPNVKLDDFVITARNFDRYKMQLQITFDRLAIPIYISSKDNISKKYPIRFIFETFDAIMAGFSSENVMKYLKNPLILDVRNVNNFQNYITRWKIKYVKKNTVFYSNPSFKMKKVDEYQLKALQDINDYKNFSLKEIFKLSDDFDKAKKGNEYIYALYSYFEDVKLALKILNINTDDFKIKQQFNQLWDIIIDSLEQFNQIYGTFEMTSQEFMQLYKNTLSTYEVATIPASVSSVYACKFEEVKKCEYLFVLGANSDDLPNLCSENAILTNKEKEELRLRDFVLADFGVELNKFELEMIFKTFLKAKNHLYMSYSMVSSDNVLPSDIFLKACDITQNITTDKDLNYNFYFKNKSTAIEKYAKLSDIKSIKSIDDSLFPIIYGRRDDDIELSLMAQKLPKTLSPTQIDQYNTCQFKYFLRYILRLEEQDEIAFSNLHNGNFVHHILEKYVENDMIDNDYTIKNNNGDKINIIFIQAKIDELTLTLKNAKKNKLSEDEIVELNVSLTFYSDKFNEFIEIMDKKLENIDQELVSLIDEYFSNVFSKNLNHDVKSEFDLKRIKENVHILLVDTLKELYLSDFKPKYCELNTSVNQMNFTTSDGELEFSIGGTIDRLDVNVDQNTAKIVDYKSGKIQYSPTKIFNGLDMQMLIYALILKDNKFADVCSIMYSHMIIPTLSDKEGDIKTKIYEKIKRTGVSIDEFNSNSLSVDKKYRASASLSSDGFENLLKIVSNNVINTASCIKNGSVSANPFKLDSVDSCGYCKFNNICGFYHEYNSYRILEKVTNSDFEPLKGGDDD